MTPCTVHQRAGGGAAAAAGGNSHLLRSPLEMGSVILPHLRGTFAAADIITVCRTVSYKWME